MSIYRNTLTQGTTLHGKSYSYCIEKVLGQGSFGITYLASVKMQGALGSIDAKVKVAIKEVFMREINGREGTTVTSGSKGGLFADYRKKFVRDATNLSKLQHPNIIKVLECFEANNTIYYSMEYLDGGSLDELISKKHGLSEAETVKYTMQIGNALSYMHEHKVLHLDLKPGNIMLNNGNAVLIDFGLSKQYDASGNPESSTTVGAGTPGYAPIEQSNYRDGKGFPVTMDIYALGATMYKMLTGERPPDASEVLNDGLPDKPASVSSEVWAAVEAAMEPMRKKRPQAVGAWVNILPEVSELFNNVEVEIVGVGNSARNMHNGHEWVDLGLSVKWATCNIGADKPEDYGDYFAWGEIATNPSYTSDNCKTWERSIGDIAGNSQYDAARAKWGSPWRLPTDAEFKELIDECDWKWTKEGGHAGYRVASKINGNSIFLPAAGNRIGTSHYSEGEYGGYWSSTPYESYSHYAYSLFFDSSRHGVDWYDRNLGRSVRPVSE